MKLLLISRHFPNIFGGVSDYTYHLSNALSKEGYEVYVLTSKDEKVINNAGDKVKVLPVVVRWNFRGLPQIIKEIKEVNPDWILLQYVPHMYSHCAIPVYIAELSILLCLMRFKLITTFHEIAIRFDLKKPKYWGIAIIERLIAYILCICSNRVVVSIEYFRKMLKPFKYKIIKMPVGSNVLPYEIPEEENQNLRKKIAPNGEFIISTFGSSGYWRRNDILLKAVKVYLDGMGQDSLKIIIIGKASLDIKLLEMIDKLNLRRVVHLTGILSPEEIYRYLAISDLFVLIDTDAYGGINIKSTSLASAYAAILPIIGNRGILTDNFFRDKENIFLINSINIEEILSAILELVNNEELRYKLKKGSEETYKNYLSWDRIAEGYEKILNEN
ncbi:MAG: glycosyltransferase family 4 protein, partial [Elusimicrobiota bacterium]